MVRLRVPATRFVISSLLLWWLVLVSLLLLGP